MKTIFTILHELGFWIFTICLICMILAVYGFIILSLLSAIIYLIKHF